MVFTRVSEVGDSERSSFPHRHPGLALEYVVEKESVFQLESEPQRFV